MGGLLASREEACHCTTEGFFGGGGCATAAEVTRCSGCGTNDAGRQEAYLAALNSNTHPKVDLGLMKWALIWQTHGLLCATTG